MEQKMRFKPSDNTRWRWRMGFGLAVVAAMGMAGAARADDLDCVSTTFKSFVAERQGLHQRF
jgi:hypothetical protein